MEARAQRMRDVLAETLHPNGAVFWPRRRHLDGDARRRHAAGHGRRVCDATARADGRGAAEGVHAARSVDPVVDLRAPAGYDIRLHDTVSNGELRYVVLDVAPYDELIFAPLQELLFYHRADLWRGAYAPAAGTWGRRTIVETDMEVSIFPGGRIDITDASAGQVGARDTYTGFCALGEDIRENDQLRNVRLQDGRRYMPDTRFVISTVAQWPQIVALRYHAEQA